MNGAYLTAGAGVVLGAALWWWPQQHDANALAALAQAAPSVLPAQATQAAPLDLAKGWISGTTRRSAAQWDSWLLTQSSLRGSSLDGDWGEIGPQGLQPSLALRQRFDQLMTTTGELSPAEMRAMVQTLAERDLGSDAAQVMAIWDRYVALTQAPLAMRPDTSHPQQWLEVLREQQALRRQWLGPQWAEAFFGADEAHLKATVQQLALASSEPKVNTEVWNAPPPGATTADWQAKREEQFGPQAAIRLASLDAEESAWELRMDLARHAVRTLSTRVELSSLQRDQALQQWLDAHFKPQEQIRVKALLGV